MRCNYVAVQIGPPLGENHAAVGGGVGDETRPAARPDSAGLPGRLTRSARAADGRVDDTDNVAAAQRANELCTNNEHCNRKEDRASAMGDNFPQDAATMGNMVQNNVTSVGPAVMHATARTRENLR